MSFIQGLNNSETYFSGSARVLEGAQLYDEDLLQMALFGDSRPHLHLFEGPMLFEKEHQEEDEETIKINTMVALKETNSGKLSSHAWALKGFATKLAPTYTVCANTLSALTNPPSILL